jgi:DnaJ-class molecular chaperone
VAPNRLLAHCRDGETAPCRQCEGKGHLLEHRPYLGGVPKEPCPDCGGKGRVAVGHVKGCHVLDGLLGKE